MNLREVSEVRSQNPIKSTYDAGMLLSEKFADADREYLLVVNLDSGNRPISFHMVGIGSVTAVHFPIANVFKTAIIQNATSILICHNHPSGTLDPSEEDIKATRECCKAGGLLGIKVLDHFILTGNNYISLKEWNPELFS